MKKKYKYYMDICEAVAQASPDQETKVGAILVHNENRSILSTGYNGHLKGAPDHLLPNSGPAKYAVFLHSEMNLIYNCAKNGIKVENSTLFCTLSPCVSCTKALYQCGITHIVSKKQYKDFDQLSQLLDLVVTSEIDENTGFTVISYGQHSYIMKQE